MRAAEGRWNWNEEDPCDSHPASCSFDGVLGLLRRGAQRQKSKTLASLALKHSVPVSRISLEG